MTNIATWKIITVAAAMTGLSLFGVATANAAPAPSALPTVTETTAGTGTPSTRKRSTGNLGKAEPTTIAQNRIYGPYHAPELTWMLAD